MKQTLLLTLLTLPLFSQTITPLLTDPFAYPGSTVNLNLIFTDSHSAPTQTAGLQWTIAIPSGLTMGTPKPGASAVTAQKAVTCTAGVCVLSGNNANVIPGGSVAVIPLTVGSSDSGPVPFTISSLVATSASGTNVPITFPDGTGSNAISINVVPSTGTTPWFTQSVGQTVCTISKVAQVPIRVSWTCNNPFGGTSGSYTAAASFTGVNSFTVSLSSLGADTIFCTISVNNTPAPATVPLLTSFNPFATETALSPTTAGYFCNSNSFLGPGSIIWP